MKIECVESLAPSDSPDVQIAAPATRSNISRNNRAADHRPTPYRKIIVTCDSRSLVDPNIVRHAVSAFVKEKVNCLIKEECVVRLHWDGVDINSIFLRSMEPLTPEQVFEFKRTTPANTTYHVDAPNRTSADVQSISIASAGIQQQNGATVIPITSPPPTFTVRSPPRGATSIKPVQHISMPIRNQAPQLINVPMMTMMPVRPANAVAALPRGVRMAVAAPRVVPAILGKSQTTPFRPPAPSPIAVRAITRATTSGPSKVVVQVPPRGLQDAAAVGPAFSRAVPAAPTRVVVQVPPADLQEASVLGPVPLMLRPAVPRPDPPRPPRQTRQVRGIRTRAPLKPAMAPVMVRFNGRVQAAQPGQLIRRTNGQIVRVLVNGTLEPVDLPGTLKKVEIKSSREKPISLDSDSDEDQPSGPPPASAATENQKPQQGTRKTKNTHVLDVDSSSDSDGTMSTESCEFGNHDVEVMPGSERRSQRIARKAKRARIVTDGEGEELIFEFKKQAHSSALNSDKGADKNEVIKPSLTFSKKTTGDSLAYESIVGPDGRIERVPLIKDVSLLQPEFEMEVEDNELSEDTIRQLVNNGIQRTLQYAPPENCRLIFRDADELDFMDTVIVQEDGEVKLDPELYQSYMQIIYKELLYDHLIFKAEQQRRKQFISEEQLNEATIQVGLDNYQPQTITPQSVFEHDPFTGTSQLSGTQRQEQLKKRGRPPKRPSSPANQPETKVNPAPPEQPVESDQMHSVHYLAANGRVCVAKTTEPVKTRQCYVIMDKISEYRIAEQIANDPEGRLRLSQDDGTPLPLDTLFAAKDKTYLYYDHERGSVDPERKRGYNWDCILRPLTDRSRGVRNPIRMYSYRHQPKTNNLRRESPNNRRTTRRGLSSIAVGSTSNETDLKPMIDDHRPVVNDITPRVIDTETAVTDMKSAVSSEQTAVTDIQEFHADIASTDIDVKSVITELDTISDAQEETNMGKKSTITPAEGNGSESSNETANVVQRLTMETRKKEIVFRDSDDDFVDVNSALGKHQPDEADDSWEAGTSDEDWDIHEMNVSRNRRRRHRVAVNRTASEFASGPLRETEQTNTTYPILQSAKSTTALHEPIM